MHNLTGTWHGLFNYPRRYAPVSFTAELTQSGEWLAGATEELAARGARAGSVMTATIMGRVISLSVMFLKTYDQPAPPYDAVRYRGICDAEGNEIQGTWAACSWSGTFLMIRARQQTDLVSSKITKKVSQSPLVVGSTSPTSSRRSS